MTDERRSVGARPTSRTDPTGCVCKCKKNMAEEPHSCPFQSDVYNDSETLCACCEDCARECLNDI